MGIWLEGKYYLGLFLAGAVAVVLVRAEENKHWFTAQASLVIILSLLALMAWAWWKENHPACQLPAEATTYDRATNKVLLCVAIGFAGVALNANRLGHWEHAAVARAIGYGSLVAGAFFMGGALLGYLFGLCPTGASPNQSLNSPSVPRTNLEEIADWLTKLILGAGLVELTRLRGPIRDLAAYMAKGVNPPYLNPAGDKWIYEPGSPPVALAIMGFFSAAGLLYGYLWTRYQRAIKEAPPTSGAANSDEQAIRDSAA
jgi:hypothetical protein